MPTEKDEAPKATAAVAAVAPVAAEKPAPEAAEFALPLAEFCTGFSTTEKRVELLAGFYHVETQAGRTHGLPSEFRKRFEEFATAVPKRGKSVTPSQPIEAAK